MPRRSWHKIVPNRRGGLLEIKLTARPDVIVAALSFDLHDTWRRRTRGPLGTSTRAFTKAHVQRADTD